jgi:hypothetical protein
MGVGTIVFIRKRSEKIKINQQQALSTTGKGYVCLKRERPISKILLIIFFIITSILISGCVNNRQISEVSSKTSANVPVQEDFVVHISREWIDNSSGIISMNYSEIIARNYSDIPTLLDLEKCTPGCGFTCNLSTISDIAMNDKRIKKVLKKGGVIVGNYVWGPPMRTKEMDICFQYYLTLELNYEGEGMVVLVNESARKVDDILGWKENVF